MMVGRKTTRERVCVWVGGWERECGSERERECVCVSESGERTRDIDSLVSCRRAGRPNASHLHLHLGWVRMFVSQITHSRRRASAELALLLLTAVPHGVYLAHVDCQPSAAGHYDGSGRAALCPHSVGGADGCGEILGVGSRGSTNVANREQRPGIPVPVSPRQSPSLLRPGHQPSNPPTCNVLRIPCACLAPRSSRVRPSLTPNQNLLLSAARGHCTHARTRATAV